LERCADLEKRDFIFETFTKNEYLNSDGSESTAAGENQEAVCAHFSKVINIQSACEIVVMKEICQMKIRDFMDEAPSDDEIKKAVLHAQSNSSEET
jgi:hypothetical protein